MRALLTSIALFLGPAAHAQEFYLPRQADEWASRTALPGVVFGSKITIEEQACCDGAQGAAPTDFSDADVVAKLRDRAFRDGRVLKLRLSDSRTLKIVDCGGDSGCLGDSVHLHRLVAWWPDKHYYVVRVIYYEGAAAYLIRESDGLVTTMTAAPVLSPDGRYALAWNLGYPGMQTMQLLDTQPEPPELREITQSIVCPGQDKHPLPGQKPVWIDNTKVAFDNSGFLGALDVVEKDSPHFRMTMEIAGRTLLRWQCQL